MALVWESLEDLEIDRHGKQHRLHITSRAKVPGGWLVKSLAGDSVGMSFLPDPAHEWNGSTPGQENITVEHSSIF